MRNWFLFCGIAFAMFCCMVLGAGEAFAQVGQAVQFTPIVNFGDLFATASRASPAIVAVNSVVQRLRYGCYPSCLRYLIFTGNLAI